MSGEVNTIKLHEPIIWKDFKLLPDDLAREHIEWLRDTYHISQRGLAEYWGIVQSTARIKAQALGIQWPRAHKKWARDDRERFWAWVGAEPETKEKQTETIVTPAPEPQPPCKQTQTGPFSGELRRERERDRIKAMAFNIIAEVTRETTWLPKQEDNSVWTSCSDSDKVAVEVLGEIRGVIAMATAMTGGER